MRRARGLAVAWLTCVAMATVARADVATPATPPAAAKKPTVNKGFWKVLVTPHAPWVLADDMSEKATGKIVVETYDVRKVGDADVARLRWSYVDGKQKQELVQCGGCFTQAAVTSAGLYMLSREQTDAEVAEALKGKPARSDPPKAYEATKRNEGRYLLLDATGNGNGVACLGSGNPPGVDCDEGTCFGEVCVASDKGVVEISGNYTPTEGPFARLGGGHFAGH